MRHTSWMPFLTLVACGDPQFIAMSSTQAAALTEGELDITLENTSSADDTCAAIEARLQNHREAMAGTPQWQALTRTEAWRAMEVEIQAAQRAACKPFDPAASAECEAIAGRLRTASATLEATPEWGALRQTPAYEVLHSDYQAMRDHACYGAQPEAR